MMTKKASVLAALACAGSVGTGVALAETTVTDDQGRTEVIYDVGILHPMPGAQLTYDYCTVCHSEMIIAQQGQTRDGWDEILVWMVDEMGMGEIDETDREMILDYLATYYSPDRPHFPQN
ncbi:aldehyde dehydrogenase [Aestuariivita boseongensis]|uniref:aldehyde dehydrogenase n=1 Tax=Aestuariivita boseongensis TaxID=1470562 RepID=UPI000AE5BD60|nr:aldehyde dehydrogenase [Aestuariivita boseongensis]